MANGTGNTQDEADARFLETMRRLKEKSAAAATVVPPVSQIKEPSIQRGAYNQTANKRTPMGREAEGVLNAVGFGDPQEPALTNIGKPSVFEGRKIGGMSPQERDIWTKKPQGIVGFDGNGLLTTDMTDYGSANRDAVNAWENKELGFNSKARNARIEYYRGAMGSLTDPADRATYEAEIKRLEGLARPNG
jgi:hypothetical protein